MNDAQITMGGVISHIKNTNYAIPDNCTYCNKLFEDDEEVFEFYPYEHGGYYIFVPMFKTDYSCKQCAYKTCKLCGLEKIKYGFIECKICNVIHCHNNTDLKNKDDPVIRNLKLCKKHKRCCKT